MNSDSTSPSLRSQNQNSKPAREVKLLLSRDQAIALESQLRGGFQLDPHCVSNAENGGSGDSIDAGYSIASVYMDTVDRKVFHRKPGYNRTKYRIRMYGAADWVFLEQKNKRGTAVWKHRTRIQCNELGRLVDQGNILASLIDEKSANPSTAELAAMIDPEWAGSWFLSETQSQQLQYVCMVKYQRRAYFRDDADSPMRVTFDTGVESTKISTDQSLCDALTNFVRGNGSGASVGYEKLSRDTVIVEFKFVDTLPTLMRNMIADLKLSLTGNSKYRSAMALLEPELTMINDLPSNDDSVSERFVGDSQTSDVAMPQPSQFGGAC